MARSEPPRPPPPGPTPRGADVRGIDYDDDLPTGVGPRQPSAPDLSPAARRGATRIDPNDVFYLTDRPLPTLTEETIRKVESAAPPAVTTHRPETQANRPPLPPSVPPPPRVPSFPSVRTPDPRTATVAFPLATRRSSRPPAREAAAPERPVPEAEGAVRPRFPPMPALRSAELPPPVEARWGNAAIVFFAGLVAVLLAALVFAVVVGLYGP